MDNTAHKFTEVGKWNDRLEMLAYDVLALISSGKKENVDTIIRHFEDGDIVHYLVNKYKGQMVLVYENCPYDLDEWEKVFAQYSYLEFGHDVRGKMGYDNKESDGFLVLLNVIIQEISTRKYK